MLIRGLYLHEISGHPDFTTPAVDADTHDYWARGLATGDWTPPRGKADPDIPHTPFVRPPGYPYFLGLIYYLAGTGPLAPRIVQMGMGLLNCVLAFGIGRRWYGRPVGLVWAGMMSCYWSLIYFEGELQATIPLVTLLLLIVYLLGRWAERMRAGYAVAAGLLLGVATLVRPNALPITVVVVGWMLFVSWRRGSARRGAVAAGLLVGCTIAAVLPATLRNFFVADDFVPISANGGINLFIGNNESATGRPSASIAGVGRFANCYDYPRLVSTLEHQLGKSLKYSEVSAYFRNKAIDYIAEHPREVLSLTLEKALLFWGPWEIANNKEIHYEREFSGVLSRIPGSFPAVLALAVVGGVLMVVGRRRGRPSGDTGSRSTEVSSLCLSIIVIMFLTILPFFVCARYRVPITPFLLLFGAAGMCHAGAAVIARRWRIPVGWLVGSGVAYLVFGVSLVEGGPDEFRWHYDRGTAYQSLDELDLALEEYETANRLAPDVPLARMAAARILLFKGRPAEAAVHLRDTLQYVHPYANEAHVLLARALIAQGQPDSAVSHLAESLRLQPNSPETRIEFAILLGELGRVDEAVNQYELVLVNEPENVEVLLRLGLLLRQHGRYADANQRLLEAVRLEPERRAVLEAAEIRLDDAAAPEAASDRSEWAFGRLAHEADRMAAAGRTREAIGLYREALTRKPDEVRVLCQLAGVLATAGEFEEAASQYKRALGVEPDLVAAHVGLGVVYVRMDDAESAITHYQEAVRIDPDNLSAYYNLGVALGDGLGRYAEAIAAMERAAVLAGTSGRADLAKRISSRIERFREESAAVPDS